MSNKFNHLLRVACLLILLASLFPLNHSALAAPPLPPVDMFQLPWEQGLAWVSLDGFDNGSKRLPGSPHNYLNGGAIDFAPHNNMRKGEDTSNFWVTAAAAGTVAAISKCHLIIAHSNGWVTEYQHLANFQVKLGDVVARNQRLAVIANASSQPVCLGSVETDIPHLHFALRPNMVGATFAGWEFKYNAFFNITTFSKGGTSVGLLKPLLNVLGSSSTPTPLPSTATPLPTGITPIPSGPYVSTEVNPAGMNVGATALVTVRLNNVPAEGYRSAEFTCTYQENLVEVSNIVFASLFGADAATAISGPQNGSFIVAIAGSHGNKATTSGVVFTFTVKALQAGHTVIECKVRVNKGDNILTDLPSIGASLTILGLTPTLTITPPPTAPFTPVFPTSTTFPADWLTFTNLRYGFDFKYPPQGQIESDSTDAHTFIRNLPIVESGTNLGEKYLEVVVGENVTECKTPLPTRPGESGVTVTINGIPFLKQTGSEPAAGNIYEWVAFSTLRDGVCVSLNFILHSINPGNSSTPPPVFDFDAESAVFGQIMSTFYTFLELIPTATPTAVQTSTPVASPSLTLTFTPVVSPTPIVSATATQITGAILTGQVIAAKVVTIRLYDLDQNFVAAVNANPDGTFRFDVAAGTYTIVATANGFLRVEGTITLEGGDVRSMPVIALLAGDIDDDNAIDQFDAMTIGFSYNTTFPEGADLNNDGIINVFDLELLAQNYRATGPMPWQ